MAWSPASKPGDTDPLISDAKKHLNRFSYGKNLGDTDEYTVEFGTALLQWQSNVHTDVLFKRREGPDIVPNGVFGWSSKKQMRILPEDKIVPAKKIVFTVAGHLGAWDTGPAYICAKWMADNGLTRVQGVGYNNVDIPFQSETGIAELMRLIQ